MRITSTGIIIVCKMLDLLPRDQVHKMVTCFNIFLTLVG